MAGKRRGVATLLAVRQLFPNNFENNWCFQELELFQEQ